MLKTYAGIHGYATPCLLVYHLAEKLFTLLLKIKGFHLKILSYRIHNLL